MKKRVLFVGTDKFGVPTLAKLLREAAEYELVGVITQPDRPMGRKQISTPPDIKQYLLENHPRFEVAKIYQPENLRADAEAILAATTPDVIVVVAYGQMIPENMLDYPKYKCLNIHGSLLPKYRGAVPIEMSLLNGDAETGVSILQMTPGLDDGPVLAEAKREINREDDAHTLRESLAEAGANLLFAVLPDWCAGKLTPKTQEEIVAETGRELSICKTSDLSLTNAEITKSDAAQVAWNKVRAFAASRGAWLEVEHAGKVMPLKIWKAEVVKTNTDYSSKSPLQIFWTDQGLMLQCVGGALKSLELQLAGKRRASASEYKFLAEK